jgi:GAF domain-containing protein
MIDERNGAEPHWQQLSRNLEQRFRALTDSVRDEIRGIVREACHSVGSAESSLLVPDRRGAHLEFLVSVNPSLEGSGIEIPCDRSIAGYVFTTGQLIAVDNVAEDPMDRHYPEVDRKTGTPTREYLAVPLMHSDETLGVLTFMNRPEGKANQSYSPREIERAQGYATLCSASLRFFQRVRYQAELVCRDLKKCAKRETGFPESFPSMAVPPVGPEDSPVLRVLSRLESLPEEDQAFCADLVDLLERHRARGLQSESAPEREEGDG